jgi:uncharacterized membrane protein
MKHLNKHTKKLKQLLARVKGLIKNPTAKQQAESKKILDFVRKNNS